MKKSKRKTKSKKTVKAPIVKVPADDLVHRTRIRVVGIGGGGGSIISEIASLVPRTDFIAANTDWQAMKQVARVVRTMPFGQKITQGLGCGMDANLGQKVAKEDKDKIAKLFQGIDLCILVSCLGGGTGSGATPEFARIAKESGAMVLGIFTTPFKFEGQKRGYIARNALSKITPYLNAVSIIPNENIFKIIDKKTPLKQAFSAINQRLAQNLKGLIEMIYLPGLINIDFADLRTILDGRGKLAYLNSAEARGSNRTEEALKTLLQNPLNEYNFKGAEKILFNITASPGVGMKEVEEISENIADANHRAKIIFGVAQDKDYQDKLRISLLAVGCGEEKPKAPAKEEAVSESEQKTKPQPESKPKPKHKQKPKARPKPPKIKTKLQKKSAKPKVKKTEVKIRVKKSFKKKPVVAKISVPEKTDESQAKLVRRSALDLVKETRKTEEEMQEKESIWDIPAFLRRKTQKQP